MTQGLRSLYVLALCVACAHRVSMPVPAPAPNELRARMTASRSPVQRYTAEIRLTYFGPQGRVRTTGSLAVERPDHLRLEVQGPHGGLGLALACDGQAVMALDVRASAFYRGSASAAHLDQLFNLVPLGLEPQAWVSLLFGDVAIPEGANLESDGREGWQWRWQAQGREVVLSVDPVSAKPVALMLTEGGVLLTRAVIAARDAQGVPELLRLKVRAAASPSPSGTAQAPPDGSDGADEKVSAENADVEIRLRDVEYPASLAAAVFALAPPAGVPIINLD